MQNGRTNFQNPLQKNNPRSGGDLDFKGQKIWSMRTIIIDKTVRNSVKFASIGGKKCLESWNHCVGNLDNRAKKGIDPEK